MLFRSSNGQTTSTATGLSIGTYSVLITDAKGCTSTNILAISEPTLLTNSITQINAACKSSSTGSATAIPSGGTPNYTFLWNNGQTTSTATGLSQATYSVLITDAKGCTTTNTATITEPTLLSSSTTQNNVSCHGDSTGSAAITISGGTPNYIYLWSNGQANPAVSSLVAGTYTVTVIATDSTNSAITTSTDFTVTVK